MKRKLNLILLFFAIMVTGNLFAQNGYKSFAATVGASTANSKYISVSFQTSSDGYHFFGLSLDGIGYSRNLKKQLDYTVDNHILALVLYYKNKLFSARNFNADFFIGGGGGSDNTSFIYYPFGGFEENFFLSKRLQLTINQKVIYLLGIKHLNNWQPSLNIGIQFSL
jgi:hypothetical protein